MLLVADGLKTHLTSIRTMPGIHMSIKVVDYGCQSIEYLYWLLMSNIGALDPSITNKCEKSKSEWFICTKEELKERDVLGFELINNYGFNLPTNIPDGNYKGAP